MLIRLAETDNGNRYPLVRKSQRFRYFRNGSRKRPRCARKPRTSLGQARFSAYSRCAGCDKFRAGYVERLPAWLILNASPAAGTIYAANALVSIRWADRLAGLA